MSDPKSPNFEDTPENAPLHEGELSLQAQQGAYNVRKWATRAIFNYLPDQHRNFYEQQPFLIASALDRQGQPWATILSGGDGFVTSPERDLLELRGDIFKNDPLEGAIAEGSQMGILGIELHSRRRNRANGIVRKIDKTRLSFEIRQAYGNCPQHIQTRQLVPSPDHEAIQPTPGTQLNPSQINWISHADTLFMASGFLKNDEDPRYGMDVSHKGGNPGFVHVLDDKTLLLPDYPGNNLFNTLGNLLHYPKAGLLFIDFKTGSLLQLTGNAQTDWNSPYLNDFQGAQAVITFTITELYERPFALPLRSPD
ncbi:pyridoxamine 5'-phosphate oxidase family protein [Sneathiella limimaris]|uniref:pyridoxamine 5'-phosphate oxidase family protein n=1 Tax=Sneathiella limimaris TaxID=1964213 RepID=UPI00146F4C96|nr:pyridoxamine 5'-phosphate oxidase family protein [Sneathiella limimaris]